MELAVASVEEEKLFVGPDLTTDDGFGHGAEQMPLDGPEQGTSAELGGESFRQEEIESGGIEFQLPRTVAEAAPGGETLELLDLLRQSLSQEQSSALWGDALEHAA